MISVVIPTLNSDSTLADTLTSLVPAAVDGLVREVIVVDAGSTDRTLDIADGAGAEILKVDAGRGAQLKAGAARAQFPWLLFLHADTQLDVGWERDVRHHMERVDSGRRRAMAAAFRLVVDDEGFLPRSLETTARLRTALLKLPYGDQGLLVPRTLYDEIGGFGTLPQLEDVDIVRRLGRGRIAVLGARAVTSGARYRREGYLTTLARNQVCLALYMLGIPVSLIAGLYGRSPEAVGEPVAQRSLP
jgi:rSAM/selenodomain-associated transferase 2